MLCYAMLCYFRPGEPGGKGSLALVTYYTINLGYLQVVERNTSFSSCTIAYAVLSKSSVHMNTMGACLLRQLIAKTSLSNRRRATAMRRKQGSKETALSLFVLRCSERANGTAVRNVEPTDLLESSYHVYSADAPTSKREGRFAAVLVRSVGVREADRND
jgi:hypothetical protein